MTKSPRRAVLGHFSRIFVGAALMCGACSQDWSDKGVDASDDGAVMAPPMQNDGGSDAGSANDGDASSAADGSDMPPRACGGGCGANASCNASQLCVCDKGFVETGTGCVADPCLAPNACGAGTTCNSSSGKAVCSCTSGLTACGAEATCLDLQNDRNNCGECGYACGTGLACAKGACAQPVHELVLEGDRSCALMEDASGNFPIRCWGYPGLNSTMFREDVLEQVKPRAIVGVPSARAMAMSQYRQCVLLPTSDKIRCWGSCGSECGLLPPTTSADSTLYDVTFDGAVRISTAGGFPNMGNTCALTSEGRIYCNGTGMMITVDTQRTYAWAIAIENRENFSLQFKDVSGSGSHTCATTLDKRVACWGYPNGDVLGVAASSLPSMPPVYGQFVRKEGSGQLAGVASTSAGGGRSCAVTDAGELWCWGANANGLLGAGNADAHVGAVKANLSDVAQVSVAGGGTCARTTSGQVYCWGIREVGGQGSAPADSADGFWFTAPRAVPGLTDAVEVRVGQYHACARRRNGTVWCWGRNNNGQIGDGTTSLRLSPVEVKGLY